MLRQTNYVGRRRLPPGVRSIVGALFVVGGAFGFLPVLGFWMIPVGAFLIALDIPGMRGVVTRWLRRQNARHNGADDANTRPESQRTDHGSGD